MMVSHEITAFTTPLFCAEAMFESLKKGQTAQDVTQGTQDTLHHRGCRYAYMARRFAHAVQRARVGTGYHCHHHTSDKDTSTSLSHMIPAEHPSR